MGNALIWAPLVHPRWDLRGFGWDDVTTLRGDFCVCSYSANITFVRLRESKTLQDTNSNTDTGIDSVKFSYLFMIHF